MLRLVSSIVTISSSLSLVAASTGGAADATGTLEALRQASLERVNDARGEAGLDRLEFDAVLNEAAQSHAQDMLDRGFYAHVTPDGQDPMDRYLAAGGSTDVVVPENIARCEDCSVPAGLDDVEWMHESWMESPGHRENILMPGLSHYGFGMVDRADGSIFGVQTFAGPGTPHGATSADAPHMPIAEQNELAVSLINDIRRVAGTAPVEAASQLSDAASTIIPAGDFSQTAIESLAPPEDILSTEQGWTRLRMLAGSCSGCGEAATGADVRFFLKQWREMPDQRQALTDAAAEAIGMAVVADGSGTKIAVALVAGD